MIKKTAIAFATSILLGAGASLTALPAVAADAPVKAEQVKSLPNIAILATGGTIASRGSGSLSLTDYGVGSGHKPVGIEVLTDAVPEIKNFANITGEQIFNVGSSKLSIANELTLAKRINEFLAKKDVDGIVVTHGTDTLEETAYFLNLVVKSDKPVALAASPEAKGKGVMVSMNDKIGSAFGVTKTNTTNVATFQCPDTGCLGIMQNNKPFFFNINTKRHTTNSEFDISKLNALPRVEINYASLGQDGSLIRSMIKMGVKGIVSAGLGHGNVPDDVMEALKEAKKAGIKVVIASRVPTGMITPVGKFTREGFQSAMLHNPQKARILLMMALTETDNDADIQRMFDQY